MSVRGPALAASAAMLLGLLSYVPVEGTGEYGLIGIAGFLVLIALASLALSLRAFARDDAGAAVAWQLMALPAAALLLLLAVPAVHVAHLLGNDTCAPSSFQCNDVGPAPAGNWLPLGLFTIATIAVFRGLGRARRAQKQAEQDRTL
jgi:hypothetical protein